MTLGRSVGNLLGGVSQQPENLRLTNTADESVNTYPSLTAALDKRRPTEYLATMASDSTDVAQFHVIKRSPTEQYGLYLYRTAAGFPFIKAFNLLTGAAVPIYDTGRSVADTADF